jgi:hypothetical protein
MFKFTMDRKDAEDYPTEKLVSAGMKEFHDGRMAIDRVGFIVGNASPNNLDEALEIINQVFYFPPVNVWIDGKKFDPFKDPNKFVKTKKL